MRDDATATDAELVARCRAGDERAFRSLYDRYAGQLERQVARQFPRRLRRRLSVADVLQETYVTAFQKIREADGPREGAFRAWLGGIATMKSREAARHHLDAAKRAARREVSQSGRPTRVEKRAGGPSPSAQAIGAELQASVDRAVLRLPTDYQAVLRLVHQQNLKVRDAADRLGRSAEATRKLYGRAVSRLAAELEIEKTEPDA